jgi:hypothetical protein
MIAAAALAPITFYVAWALALVGRTQAGQAIYSIKADGRPVGRVVQCRRADGTGGTGFLLELDGAAATIRTHLRDWHEVRDVVRNPRVYASANAGRRWQLV